MEADPRSFVPARLGIVNAETARARFERDNAYRSPRIASWRVNLTALSQRYNLYFVAIRDTIQVYRPDFPYQNLGSKPSLTIVPQLANISASGFIDPGNPHHINHIVVGDLGNQEILLLSTDSGNVVAYYTRSINVAVRKDAYKFSADGNADFVGLRPFFSDWVHESAWGLAIHSEGRMIAVSANTPNDDRLRNPRSKITVFAFALIESDTSLEEGRSEVEGSTVDMFEWKLWTVSPGSGQPDTLQRDCNYKIVLAGPEGHCANVPCVTFVNTPEDPMGSWLLSTDITGAMKMWQIWKGRCFRNWNLLGSSAMYTPWGVNQELGWVVAVLDVNAFRPAESMETFLGYHRVRQYYGYNASGDSFDLTDTVPEFTPQNGRDHPLVQQLAGYISNDDGEGDELNADAMNSEDEITDQPSLRRPDIPSELDSQHTHFESLESVDDRQILEDPDHEMVVNISEDDDDDDGDDGEEDVLEGYVESTAEIEITGHLSDEEGDAVSTEDNEIDHSPTSSRSVASDSSDDETFNDADAGVDSEFLPLPLSPLRRKGFNRKSTSNSRTVKSDDHAQAPSIPIIHCSTSHVRLFSGPNSQYPHIFCARMLRQAVPAPFERLVSLLPDRLNMLHQIPELGIVLIATQLGRCAVCTLTKRKNDGLLGFRVDWILPTEKQEREGLRPADKPLLGIAASPIQGRTRSRSNTLSEHNSGQEWAQDRMIHGTRTTFDPEVVVLGTEPPKRSENSHSVQNPKPGSLITERRKWPRPKQMDKWIANQPGRTYRVMLTYTDMTVLTYELTRDVEKEDMHT